MLFFTLVFVLQTEVRNVGFNCGISGKVVRSFSFNLQTTIPIPDEIDAG
ncbi:MAG: hypothetical protein PUP92_16465 [Rhizonema sp. PD38]|nr:hypothetical protein [Rhizonema sp. PD38]